MSNLSGTMMKFGAIALVVGAGLLLLSKDRGTPTAAVAAVAQAPICTGDAGSGSAFYSEMAEAGMRMHHAMNVAPSGDPDRDFARMMIPHHQGAIDMALIELKYGRDVRLKRLAQSIVVEQQQEIAYMRSLLDAAASENPAINHGDHTRGTP